MDADRIDVVTEWEGETISDGYAGLRRLADRGFSGVVTDGAAWLFMLNGRVVGVSDGDLSEFEDASGTAYEAPHESLPLLFAMQERGGEVRTKYYTNDTPVSEADRTLSAGNFTGYIELSENVLSGDYYVAYYGGESLSAAFVGNARQVKTGSEAFDLADDEVGIYTVYEVDLDVREVPGANGSGPGGSAAAAGAAGATAAAGSVDESDSSGSEGGIEIGGTDAGTDPGGADRGDSADPPDTGPSSDVDESAATDPAEADEPTGSDDVRDDAHSTASTSAEASPDAGTNGSDPAEEVENAGEEDVAREENVAGEKDVAGEAGDPARADSTADSTGDPAASTPDRSRNTSGTSRQARAGSDSEPDRAPSDSKSDRAPSGSGPDRNPGTRARSGDDSDVPDDEDVFSEEAEWREAKSIPSLDPSESRPRPPEDARSGSGGNGERGGRSTSASAASGATSRSESKSGSETKSGSRSGSSDRSSTSGDEPSPRTTSTAEEPREGAVTERERPSVERNRLNREINRLESELTQATEERDELAAERDRLVEERDDLEAETQRLEERVSELEEELDRVRTELSNARSQLPEGERVISAEEAIAETNLFIRYDSKSGATLQKVHAGEADRDELVSNLRIEHHTSFEDDDVVVEGQPYREFLTSTMEYGFTNWLVTELPFEIRETGAIGGLQDLYEVLPEIDRSEIGGTVSVTFTENGEEHREQRTFDLVLRDRMGNPLIVADLNDGRDPTVESSLNDLVENGSRIAESSEEFAAGFGVTSSFFEPEALEAAGDATGGGLLSRSKKRSYVKISRKRGFHLCLAESRDGGFHLTVPEL
jgi:hypothetical protein